MGTTVTLSCSCHTPTHRQVQLAVLSGVKEEVQLSDQCVLSTADPEYPLVGLGEKNMPLIRPHCQIFVS